MSHIHEFESWPFKEPVNTAAFTTRQVLRDAYPVLQVDHDHDGDWQFLCGTTLESEDLTIVCMGCVLERDPMLALLADLPAGWFAVRDSASDNWSRSPYDDSDE